jgi:hypothetical protein
MMPLSRLHYGKEKKVASDIPVRLGFPEHGISTLENAPDVGSA